MSEAAETPSLARRVVAEGLGTAFLLAAIVGSGIMAERSAGGNAALALLASALATGAALVALILALGPLSAHFNPSVTLLHAARSVLRWRDVGPYLLAQGLGAFAGVAAAHVMFGEALFTLSSHQRGGAGQILSEIVATFGLLLVVWAAPEASGAPRRLPWPPTSPRPTGSPHLRPLPIPPFLWRARRLIPSPASGPPM